VVAWMQDVDVVRAEKYAPPRPSSPR
jgi:hypothetical protein